MLAAKLTLIANGAIRYANIEAKLLSVTCSVLVKLDTQCVIRVFTH